MTCKLLGWQDNVADCNTPHTDSFFLDGFSNHEYEKMFKIDTSKTDYHVNAFSMCVRCTNGLSTFTE
jgi:hypothetical protein